MKKLIFILPIFLMTSCIKSIKKAALGEEKDRVCECTYTASGKPEKKESTTIKGKNQVDGESDCSTLSTKYYVDAYSGTCILQN